MSLLARRRAGSLGCSTGIQASQAADSRNTTATSSSENLDQTHCVVTTLQPHYQGNQQYSIIALTNSSGSIVERYAYTAYGRPTITAANGTVRTTSAHANRTTYTGREWDETAELYHYRARMYDPGLGRFLGRDPIGYVDGENLYAPYFVPNSLDPTGTSVEVCWRMTRIRPLSMCFYHYWIKTDEEEIGRGARDKCFGNCPCAKTKQTDHKGETPLGCEDATDWMNENRSDYEWNCSGPEVEQCIAKQLEAEKPLGPFIPIINDCKSFVIDNLSKCCKKVRWRDPCIDKGTGRVYPGCP